MNSVRISSKAKRTRLDAALMARGLAETPRHAQALILAGEVRVDGQMAGKPGDEIAAEAHIEIASKEAKYASRAGLKLEGALEDFGVSAEDRICADIGASNGGFTDCLLQHGARRVYAVDVNTRQLEWKLRRDERLIAVKKNARHLKPGDIAELAELVTIDVSFISVAKILEPVLAIVQRGGEFLILMKPQFELPKALVGEGGIVGDRLLHERAIKSVCAVVEKADLRVLGVRPSRVTGAEGNQEYFLHARLRE